MREILVKNLTSEDRHWRKLDISESVEQDGVLAASQRRCLYFLREVKRFPKAKTNTKIRYLNIVKNRNTSTNRESLTYQIAGRSYILIGQTIFCVFFTHIFKIEITKPD